MGVQKPHVVSSTGSNSHLVGGNMETRTSGRREDPVTGAIESVTSNLPSSGFLGIALGAMAASAVLRLVGRKELALFIGEWVPSILVIGVYNKMVKQHGSDSE